MLESMSYSLFTHHFRWFLKNSAIIHRRFYAVGKPVVTGKIGAPQPAEDQTHIDMDTEKLTKYCCCNYLKEGSDVPLKSDSEYPLWLFKLRLGPPPTLDELNPSDIKYWQRYDEFSVRERLERRRNFFRSVRTQLWLKNVKKIPEEEIQGDIDEYVEDKGNKQNYPG